MNRINRQFEEDDYVIGGSEAIANSFPWVVRIRGGCAGKIYLAGVSNKKQDGDLQSEARI